jgi:hypothetical protein
LLYVRVAGVQIYKPGFGGPSSEMLPYGTTPKTKHGHTMLVWPPKGYADAGDGALERAEAKRTAVTTARLNMPPF